MYEPIFVQCQFEKYIAFYLAPLLPAEVNVTTMEVIEADDAVLHCPGNGPSTWYKVSALGNNRRNKREKFKFTLFTGRGSREFRRKSPSRRSSPLANGQWFAQSV